MKTIIAMSIAALVLVGCGSNKKPADAGPVEGTVVQSEMSIEEQISKIQADKNIPEEYKQTYINSLRDQAAKESQGVR